MLILHFYFLILIHEGFLADTSTDPNNYGPYISRYDYYEACRGPKSKNMTTFDTMVLNDNIGVLNFTVPARVRIEEIKIFVFSLIEKRKKLLWNYKVDNPCQHYALGYILEKHFKIYDCVVEKGNHYTEVNFTETTHKFLGPSFFYGDFLFKFIVLCKTGNIACLIFHTAFMKKV